MLQCYFLARLGAPRNSYMTGRDRRDRTVRKGPPEPARRETRQRARARRLTAPPQGFMAWLQRDGLLRSRPDRGDHARALSRPRQTVKPPGVGRRGSRRRQRRRHADGREAGGKLADRPLGARRPAGVRVRGRSSDRNRDARTASEHLTPFHFLGAPKANGTRAIWQSGPAVLMLPRLLHLWVKTYTGRVDRSTTSGRVGRGFPKLW